MPTNPSHFIEQVKFDNGEIKHLSLQPFRLFADSDRVNKKFNVNVIAVFKIYPKPKPMIAIYDYDLKTTIVE